MRKKGFLSLSLICLLSGLSAGCADRTVDYDLNGAGTESAENFSLEQFVQTERWNDEITVVAEDGKEIGLKVNAEIVLPDTDAMSVVEVEETVIDGEYKKELLTLFFENNEIYYHDAPHCTREELENMIAETEDEIAEAQRQISRPKDAGLPENQYQDFILEIQEWIDSQEKLIQEYEECLQTAKDTYTLVKDFDICNEYAAYRDGVLYSAVFGMRNEERQAVSQIDIHTMGGQYQGPESLKDFESIFRQESIWSCVSEGEEVLTNECALSQEEARALADRFVNRSGRADQICFQESDIMWSGQQVAEDGHIESEESFYGYEFVYGTGIDGVAFSAFGGLTDDNDQMRITVTDAGITDVRIVYPITVTHVTEQVNLLPLTIVQDIMKNELEENSNRYNFVHSRYFTLLELRYLRLKDNSKTGCYSYVPVWCLCTEEMGTYHHPVLVNAIDGSVIYVKDEL